MNNHLSTIVAHSVAPNGNEIITYQLRYQRFIHAELMTHRVFSRNASSSRAIPVAKMISQVWNDPATPIHWGANQPGMQAKSELIGLKLSLAKTCWRTAAKLAASVAWVMNKAGAHKQVANRILEPFQYISVVLTSTEFDNWNSLRAHKDAQPEIYALAIHMMIARGRSQPRELTLNRLSADGWHLPYVSESEIADFNDAPLYLAKISSARCARVSYVTHDKKIPIAKNDIALFERLVGGVPLHASPTEHQAYSLYSAKTQSKNFFGFGQFRHLVEHSVLHNEPF